MGLFGSNFTKPGPGVAKDAPKKRGFFLFFELLARKFTKLIQANILYFFASLPMLFFALIFAAGPVEQIAAALYPQEHITPEVLADIDRAFRLLLSVSVVAFCGSGPASAALSYIMRCFTREEHSWIWTDFVAKFKENFKQGIAVSIINIVVLVLGYVVIRFYYLMYLADQNQMGMLWRVLMYLVCMMLFVFICMHFYIYQFMVTFENKLSKHYRNAAILAIAYLPMNLFLFGVMAVLNVLFYIICSPSLALFLTALFWLGILRFPMEFFAARVIQRRVLDQMETTKHDGGEDL